MQSKEGAGFRYGQARDKHSFRLAIRSGSI
jgi:hypothetical protein